MRWPIAITASAIIVVLVNAAFIWVAFGVDDEVVASYASEAR
jgi:hypothetical protein